MTKQNEIKDVQPIRSLDRIEDMKWSLKKWCGERDYILFLLGINSGLRVGDLLNIKTSEIQGKKVVSLREGKTGKRRTIHLGNIYDELNAYIGMLNGTEWLFPSRKGQNPITRVQTYRQLNKAAQMVDMPDGIGTHTHDARVDHPREEPAARTRARAGRCTSKNYERDRQDASRNQLCQERGGW